MNKEIDCAVVKDLLPIYIDRLTSAETNQVLENHFSNCADCARERDEMMGSLNMEKAPKKSNLENFLNKTKKMYILKGVAWSIGIIGILVSFIVDIAVNHKLTWSLIVDGGIVFLYITALAAILSKRNKIIASTLVSSILVLPLLYMIEYIVNENYLVRPIHWFTIYALPITLIWLAIIWIVILINKILKLNMWRTLGILLLFAIFGSALTNAISNQVSVNEIYQTGLEWIDSLSYLGGAILCFIIGHVRKDKGIF